MRRSLEEVLRYMCSSSSAASAPSCPPSPLVDSHRVLYIEDSARRTSLLVRSHRYTSLHAKAVNTSRMVRVTIFMAATVLRRPVVVRRKMPRNI